MLVKTYSAAVNGLDVTTVRVEVNIVPGVMYHLTGLGDTAVRESRDRIASALQFNGYKFPHGDITINLAPADLRKEGSSFDLPLAIAILAASGAIVSNSLDQYMMVGELGLDGTLQPIKGALPIAIKARAEKLKGLIVPKQNEREAAVVNNLEVYGMSNIMDVIKLITGAAEYEPTFVDTRREFYEQQYSFDLDFADVRGQESVRRALEVAAAGGHNLIMVGPPGSGKSMMAKRLPSILPPLSLAESLETTQIHSVLFADELPEFNKKTLEVLRQPLEDHKITISRSKYTVEFPCSFMFIASMNPCPCGYFNDPTHNCCCSTGQIQRYMNKISGPLLDRIDIQCEITPVPFKDISKSEPGEPSAAIRERVIKARDIQTARFKEYRGIHCNAQMTERMIHQFAEPDEQSIALLRTAMEKFSLSARAYNRILKVARTIADLAGSERVEVQHISEAIGYRNLDRGDWAERRIY